MLDDAMEGLEDEEEMEEAVQAEVDKVLFELTAGKLGDAPAAVTATLPAPAREEKQVLLLPPHLSRPLFLLLLLQEAPSHPSFPPPSPPLLLLSNYRTLLTPGQEEEEEDTDLEEMQSRLEALRS